MWMNVHQPCIYTRSVEGSIYCKTKPCDPHFYFSHIALSNSYFDFIKPDLCVVPCQSVCVTHNFTLPIRGSLYRHTCITALIFLHRIVQMHDLRKL
jgi:hypothetical protein